MTEAVEVRLALEWELWVVENLLGGASENELVDALTSQGIEAGDARRRVREIRASEAFQRIRTRTRRAVMSEQALRMRARTSGPIEIDVDPSEQVDLGEFHEKYWKLNRPVLFKNLVREMEAVRQWSLAGFAERFGDVDVTVNVGRESAARRSSMEHESKTQKLGEFIDHIRTSSGNDSYIVSRNGLLSCAELKCLEAELNPRPPLLGPIDLPRGVSLWIGPGGTKSPAHFDPHNVLFVQIEGTKRVRLVPPDQPAVFDSMDGYYVGRSLDDEELHSRPDFDSKSIVTVDLKPGEALFVPVGWFHEVTALDPSMMLSFVSFQWDNDFHWVGARPSLK